LLPEAEGFAVANLNYSTQLALTELGYIDGNVDVVVFQVPGTSFSFQFFHCFSDVLIDIC